MKQQETNILIEMNKTMGEVVGEVKGINKRLDKLNGSVKNHDDRINKNESKIDTMLGKVSVIGSLGVFIGGLIMWLFDYFTK